MQDVLIIGGGVIGLSLAYELARQGVGCAIVDQGGIGQESSWAGAGILPPGNPDRATSPEARLRAASHVLWPELSRALRDETGVDNGYARCGGLEVRLDGPADELDEEVRQCLAEGVEAVPLAGRAPYADEPALGPRTTAAYRLPEMGQVRNPRHLKALAAACAGRGVRILPGTAVHGFVRDRGRVTAVESSSGRLPAGQFVVASGAWSGGLLAQVGCAARVRPLRGQIVLLSLPASPIRPVINVGPRYLVPRGDGRVLVGSTEEVAGFDKRTTAAGVGGLIEFALGVVAALAGATVERTWAGLRPESVDGLPYLGRVPSTENLFCAAGHFRSGLQLSPITALMLSRMMLGQATPIPAEPYAVDRRSGSGDFPVRGRAPAG